MPKLKLVGFVVRLPGAVPVPETAMFTEPVEPSLARAKVPFTLPAAVGLNTIWKLAVCCGARVRGKLKPVVLKLAPLTISCVTITVELPVLVRTSFWLWVPPMGTFPKLTLAGAAASMPVTEPVTTLVEDFPTLSPWQPSILARASRTGIAIQRPGDRFIKR